VPQKKLTYKEQRELDALPAKIEALETEQQQLSEKIASPSFYKDPAATIAATLARLEQVQAALLATYARWDTLDSRKA
jgi:ATP-binding cassette subfamily F protein uup